MNLCISIRTDKTFKILSNLYVFLKAATFWRGCRLLRRIMVMIFVLYVGRYEKLWDDFLSTRYISSISTLTFKGCSSAQQCTLMCGQQSNDGEHPIRRKWCWVAMFYTLTFERGNIISCFSHTKAVKTNRAIKLWLFHTNKNKTSKMNYFLLKIRKLILYKIVVKSHDSWYQSIKPTFSLFFFIFE